ncbi:MAG: hypothetical protein GXP38_06435 [Chloroflexi bacterium]|nr:hypothetical protein [Chloroflexota bacterium]
MKDIKGLLSAYEVDVRFPDVSGMEQLNMLQIRSELARLENELSREQREQLATADKILLRQADQFFESIQGIADLERWRREEKVPPEHWWWYLDVIARLPKNTGAPKVAA